MLFGGWLFGDSLDRSALLDAKKTGINSGLNFNPQRISWANFREAIKKQSLIL
jgi:hypothetical protein